MGQTLVTDFPGDQRGLTLLLTPTTYHSGNCKQLTHLDTYPLATKKQTNTNNFVGHMLTNPGPVQVDGDEGGGDGEVVHEGVSLQHEPEFVRRSNEADEEVDHEEDVEGEINLLCGVLHPWYARLHTVAVIILVSMEIVCLFLCLL